MAPNHVTLSTQELVVVIEKLGTNPGTEKLGIKVDIEE